MARRPDSFTRRPDSFKGLDLTSPQNRIEPGRVASAVNVRAYTEGGFQIRTGLGDPIVTVDSSVNSLCRMNDTTPTGPGDGYCLIIGTEAGSLFVFPADSSAVATGLSGDPMSIVPFRPNTSVKPWGYAADSSMGVELSTKYALNDSSATFSCFGQIKVRSDGLVYKTGIKEPPLAPEVGTGNTVVVDSGPLLATSIPWTNYSGQNPDYDYGETDGPPSPTPDGTPPFIVDCANASFIKITALSGSATINGGTKIPTDLGPSTAASTNPGHYIQIAGTGMTPATATVVTGAFTDGAGNVIPKGVAPLWVPSVVDVGDAFATSAEIQVPAGAQAFQIGINSTGDTYSDNSGEFEIAVEVTTESLPPNVGILGSLSLYYWGDSPVAGGVASYLWKNPGDTGGGIPRSTSNAVGNTSGNSFIFDATFTAGEPGLPGLGTEDVPMQWYALSAESAVTGSSPVFPSPITTTYPSNTSYNNFNFCLYGKIYIPEPGQYTFVLTSHDDCIWGIQDASLVSAVASGSGEGGSVGLSNGGQTITVAQGYPLLPRQNYTSGEGGNYAQTTVVVSFAASGTYGIEVDYDYWYHSGRILLLEASPTPGAPPAIIPPLTQGVRQGVSYAYKYRSSLTGAQSNPSPTTTPSTTPVLANTVTPVYSPDPQVDKVDYYRQDTGLANFTYVATGPNTDPPTTITDSLTDAAAAGNQEMTYDDYEPVPSIDLPQAGHCNVSGGVITTLDTPFNERWLPGTIILIGYPTQLPYSFISRPISDTQVAIPGVPDGTNLVWNIAEPILANQPLAYMFGPTDNINFVFAVGDPLRPGTLYWCSGSNLDAWPDTNQFDVTDPSEALVNGAMSAGRGVLFSIRRAWIIEPNFYNALATVTGTSGSTWTLRATSIARGLFIPRCVCIEGGGNIFFRVDDGIHFSRGGAASVSITDEDLYPLFSHEGSTPQPIIRNGVTYWPPDDSRPEKQQFREQNGYLYYDYAYSFESETFVEDVEFVPDSGATAGVGIPWQQPLEALASGTPEIQNITSWSVSANVFTFVADNDFAADELVTFADMDAGGFLNGLMLPVLSSGLSSTQFEVSFPWANTGPTADSGTATPALPNYASVTLPAPPFTPEDGEYVAYSLPTSALSPETGSTTFAGAKAGIAAASWIAGGACGTANIGLWDTPFLAEVDCGWSGFTVPDLPAGAVITRIYPVLFISNLSIGAGMYVTISAGVGMAEVWNNNTGTIDGQNTAPGPEYSLGSTDADITGAYVNLNLTARTGPWPGGADISSVMLAVYYTLPSGSPPPAGQTQSLELTGTPLALPSDTVIAGVKVDFATGLAFGGVSIESAQLTVSNSPVGTAKPLNPGSWPSPYSLGGNGDLWGQGSMTGAQANDLGVTFGADLNAGSQLNLNDVSITVYYETEAHEEGSATLVYDIRAGGWILDSYDVAPTVHAPNEGESQQGILVGCIDGTVRPMESDAPEEVAGLVLSPAIGVAGWGSAYQATFEYMADSGAIVSFVAADEGNNSYAPNPIILGSTNGQITKFTTKLSPNKWKLLQQQVESTDPSLQFFFDGCVLEIKAFGSDGPFVPVRMFRPAGGEGAQR